MHQRDRVRVVSSFLGLVALSGLVVGSADAFSSGPPDGWAGDPAGGGITCVTCHASFPLNSGDGSVTVTGLPATYTPGATYDLSVVLEDPGQMRWGFELTVLDPAEGAGGDLIVTDAVNTQLSDNPGTNPDYLKQTSAGTFLGTLDGPVEWTFQWTAPDEPEVTIYLAANAANADGGTSGDYIYAISQTVGREDPTPIEATSWSRLKSLYE